MEDGWLAADNPNQKEGDKKTGELMDIDDMDAQNIEGGEID